MKNRAIVTIAVIVGLITLLSACSGFIGDGANLSLTINKPSSDEPTGRFVSADTNEVYVALIKGRSVYFFNTFNVSGSVGTIFVGGLIPDTYILGVVLLDNTERVVGIAVKDAKIQPGRNEIAVDVGPGVTFFDLNGVDIRNPLDELDSGYTLSFKEDSVLINSNSHSGVNHDLVFTPTFGASDALFQPLGGAVTVTDLDGNAPLVDAYPNFSVANSPGIDGFIIEVDVRWLSDGTPVWTGTDPYSIRVEID